MDSNWHNRTLEELEGECWSSPNYDSHVVIRTHQLRKIPLKDFSIEDLRLMIGQEFSLNYLLPIALDVLKTSPLAEGDYYEGDLLVAVLAVNATFWEQHPDLLAELTTILEAHKDKIGSSDLKLPNIL